MSVQRVQPEQAAPEVQGVEIGGLREEPFQEEPLPEDVRVRPVPQEEELLRALRLEEPHEALRRVEVEKLMIHSHFTLFRISFSCRSKISGVLNM